MKSPKPTQKLDGTINTKIQVINEETGKTPPIVGYFPTGIDPINNKKNLTIDVETLRNKKKTRRIELVVKPNGCNVNYVGTNYSGEAAAGKVGSNRIALVDKVSKTITFIPIVSGKVLRLEPKLSKSNLSEEPATPVKTEFTNEELREKHGNLTATFGTAKNLKQVNKKLQLQQLDDPSSQQELKQILSNTDVDKKAIESASKYTNPNVPPHDVSATTAANAYPLDKIILDGEWGYVEDIFQLAQAGQELAFDVYPSFVYNRSSKVTLLKDNEEEKRKIARIMSYITHLVNFKNKHSLEGFTSAKHHKIPSMLLQKFTKMFLSTEKKKIADDKIEAILSYILVLTLHVDEFKTDFTDIAKDLKMTAISLRPYLENLGCKFISQRGVTLATLPVPLTFPSVRRKRKRGGK